MQAVFGTSVLTEKQKLKLMKQNKLEKTEIMQTK